MYKFNIQSIISYDEGYYSAFINKIILSTQEVILDNQLRLGFKVELFDSESGSKLDSENPLLELKGSQHSSPTSQLIVNLYGDEVEDKFLWFFSKDLDDYIDLEIRTKFPNEDIENVKITFVETIIKFLEEKGLSN